MPVYFGERLEERRRKVSTARASFGFALFLFAASSALAQQGTTGELTGRVTSSGQALPGVTVTLTSNSLQGNRVAVSGENGSYLFAWLPPGDCLVRAELEGFSPTQKQTQVSLAATTRLDFGLEPTPLREIISIESDGARVEEDASIGMNLRASELQRLPGGRDIRAAVLLSPNAAPSGPRNRIIIEGAPSWDSLFLVDGVVVNEYLTGQPQNLFIEDAIQEIALLTGAISAEYGRFTGGVVSTVTKRGGNTFHASIRDSVTNAAWTARTPWPGEPAPLDRINHTAEGTLGGFLLKDRVWFFAAARKADGNLRGFTFKTNVPYNTGSHDQRWEWNTTARIGPEHLLVGSYLNASLAETNVNDLRSAGNVLDLASLIPRRWQPANHLAVTYEGVLTPNMTAEIQGSRKRYALRGNGGQSTDRVLGTLILVRGLPATLNAPFGCGICGEDRRDSHSLTAKASHYRNTRWGNHTVVAGVDRFHEQRLNRSTRSSSEFNIWTRSAGIDGSVAYPRFDETTQIDWTRPYPSAAAGFNSWSGYLNDRWDLSSRLSVNLGMRYDRNHAMDAAGQRIADDSGFSPRVSAAFDLRNDGRHRLFGSFGRYAAKILEGGGAPQQIGTFTEYAWAYGGPKINADGTPAAQLLSASDALARLFAWFDSIGGIQTRQPLNYFVDPVTTSRFPGSLRSPAVDEWSVGYATQMQSGYLRADYLSRDWRHFYAARVDTTTGQTTDPQGRPLDVAWIVNDDSDTVRTYRAVALEGSWRRGRTSIGGGYTWSKLRGNDDGEEGTVSAPRNLPLTLWYPEFLGYPQRRPIGYLKQDQRHRARVWLTYEAALVHGSLSAALLQRLDSGQPYSAVADIDPTGRTVSYQGVPENPGYALNQVATGPYFFSKRGAFRTDDLFSTDLAVSYDIPVHSLRLFLKGDVLNLLNNAAVVSPGTEVITRFGGGINSGLHAFNPFTEQPVEGVHYRLSPKFGQATGPASYQTPRTFQFSMGARF